MGARRRGGAGSWRGRFDDRSGEISVWPFVYFYFCLLLVLLFTSMDAGCQQFPRRLRSIDAEVAGAGRAGSAGGSLVGGRVEIAGNGATVVAGNPGVLAPCWFPTRDELLSHDPHAGETGHRSLNDSLA